MKVICPHCGERIEIEMLVFDGNLGIKDDEINRDLLTCCKALNVSKKVIMSRSQFGITMAYRHIISFYLMSIKKHKLTKVAKCMKKHHATIKHSVAVIEDIFNGYATKRETETYQGFVDKIDKAFAEQNIEKNV